MGFMAGFGDAFSKGLERNQLLREKRKDDVFRMTFNEYSKRDEEYREKVKADEKDARKAKTFAEMKDPALMPKVLEWVKGGMSDDQIMENLQTGTFETGAGKTGKVAAPDTASAVAAVSAPAPTEGAGTTPVAKNTSGKPQGVGKKGEIKQGTDGKNYQWAETSGMQGASGSSGWIETSMKPKADVNQQTEDSGLVLAQAQPGDKMVSGPQAREEHKGLLSGLSGKFKQGAQNMTRPGGVLADSFGNGSRSMGRYAQEARDQMGQISGRSPEEMGRVMSGDVPENPALASAGAIKFTPAPPAEKADPINTIPEAALSLDAAKLEGDPTKIARRQRRLDILKAEANEQAEREAVKNQDPSKLKGAVQRIIRNDGTEGMARVDVLNGQKVDLMDIDPKTNQPRPLDPNATLIPVTQEERAAMDKIDQEISKPKEDVRVKKEGLKSSVRLYDDMNKIVTELGDDVLQPITTGAAQIGQQLSNELAAANNVLQGAREKASDPNMTLEAKASVIEGLEAQAADLEKKYIGAGSYADKLATGRTLLEAKQLIMSYQVGLMMGQKGASVSAREQERFLQVAAGGRTAKKFQKGMGDFLLGQAKNLDAEEKGIYENSVTLNRFKSKGGDGFGWTPPSYQADPVSTFLDDNVSSFKNTNHKEGDEGLASGWEAVKYGSGLPIGEVDPSASERLGIKQPQGRTGSPAPATAPGQLPKAGTPAPAPAAPAPVPQAEAPQAPTENDGIPVANTPTEAQALADKAGPGVTIKFKTPDGRVKTATGRQQTSQGQ